jgi:hypothetical protein
MTLRQFYDWQTTGGGGDVMRLVQSLEQEEIPVISFLSFSQ